MKNLNVRLAENFNVELESAVNDNGDLSEEKFNELISYSEKFLTDLAKKGLFLERNDIIEIEFPLELCCDEAFDFINTQQNDADIIYRFNKCQELECLRIIGAFCY